MGLVLFSTVKVYLWSSLVSCGANKPPVLFVTGVNPTPCVSGLPYVSFTA